MHCNEWHLRAPLPTNVRLAQYRTGICAVDCLGHVEMTELHDNARQPRWWWSHLISKRCQLPMFYRTNSTGAPYHSINSLAASTLHGSCCGLGPAGRSRRIEDLNCGLYKRSGLSKMTGSVGVPCVDVREYGASSVGAFRCLGESNLDHKSDTAQWQATPAIGVLQSQQVEALR
jgi:hypothetical protein